MTQWEYTTLQTNQLSADPKYSLNDLGRDGWEFVSLIPNTTEYPHLLFKRPMAPPKADERHRIPF